MFETSELLLGDMMLPFGDLLVRSCKHRRTRPFHRLSPARRPDQDGYACCQLSEALCLM